MAASRIERVHQVLTALEKLNDDDLRAVIARAQGLLLDRPGSRDVTPALAVELVGCEEGRLLAAYRALAPLRQRRLVSHVLRLVRASRPLARRQKQTTAPARSGLLLRHGQSATP